ncbi:MAG: SDR family NAD(P)-dependent oxidoreductase [Coriobacteriales bacterium]|jgi:short-subunit dehydrogenase|nr:SDR family NAD(P)-dependent oxidoreductase [Coriobacteriales bacterium]
MKSITIVTGASSGLGYEIAKIMAEAEASLCLVARSSERLNQVKEDWEQRFPACEIVAKSGDISDESFVKSVYSGLLQQGFCVEHLINCAGAGYFGPPENNSREGIDRAFAGSLIGLILMSSEALVAMQPEGGCIVNILSTAALKGNPNESVYCAAKWGARGFAEALKAHTKGSKTQVINVFPGGMQTPFWSEHCGMQPDVSRFLDPVEVAQEVVRLLLPRPAGSHPVHLERNEGSSPTSFVSDITIARRE